MERVEITMHGTYAYSMKPELRESLAAAIEQHMKAYGLKDIEVVEFVSEAKCS